MAEIQAGVLGPELIESSCLLPRKCFIAKEASYLIALHYIALNAAST